MKTNTLDFDAQALREKILDLAMRGKLVPQDPNDEPASVLLEKIKAEKEQLIKEKKIKKSKPLAPITDDEKPFDIPDSWEWVRLGDVSKFVTKGTTPKGGKNAYIPAGVNFYRAENLKNNSLLLQPIKHISNEVNNNELKRSRLAINDILVTIAGTLGNVAIVKKENLPGNCNQAVSICRLVNTRKLNEAFLVYALSNETQNIIKKKRTTSIPNLTLQHISNAVIPIPPLEEQSRIAAKIAQLFALLRKVESSTQQYAKLQTLLKSKVLDLAMRGKLVKQDSHDEPASLLLEKIKVEKEQLVKEGKIKKSKLLPPITDDEKPFDIPDSWEWVRGVDITDTIGDGLHGTPKFSSYGIPFINGSNLKNDKITITSSTKYVSVSEFNKYKKALRPGTLFISLNGTLGKIAKYNGEKIVLGKSAGFFSLLNAKMQNYIAYYLKSTIFINYYNIKYTGSVIKNIPLKALRECLIPLPPLAEQRKIVTKLSLLFNILDF
ncbi:hypothetical protein BHU41_10235 [Lactobacillus crispatus]|uniref:Type I restriction modification DNA specificity domain-containing protein n=1 Tax=Lactobacillus crispatus TaxID=47770 RepID=A0A2M9WLX9_9LACO|nr:restriction endonuclease subunit S [Lactobacillus crispatus]PJZ16431.1 hypothetical protein BHU41_10235 [Lactobacillus crispatus]